MVEKGTIVEQQRRFLGGNGGAAGNSSFRHLLRLLIAAVVLLVFVLGIVTGYLEKWLWMRQLDYTGIFWTLLSVQWAMFCSAFAFTFLFLWINCVRLSETAPLCALTITHGDLPFYPEPIGLRRPASISLPGS